MKYKTEKIKHNKKIEYEYNRITKLLFVFLLIISINEMFETEQRKNNRS